MFISNLNRAHDDLYLCSLAWPLLQACAISVFPSWVCLPFLGHLFLEHSSDDIVISLTIFILSGLCHGKVLQILG